MPWDTRCDMRISAREDDPGFTPLVMEPIWTIFLDGYAIEGHIVSADEERGEIERICMNAQGMSVLEDGPDGPQIKREFLHGKVWIYQSEELRRPYRIKSLPVVDEMPQPVHEGYL